MERVFADGVSSKDITRGLREVGLHPGHVVLVHSALSTFGHVHGGASSVVSSLLEVIGETGTLVAPAFTFRHEAEEDPIIDPRNDRSEMGVISETIRTHPRALRSIAFRHSLAAIGRWAPVITDIDPALSTFDLRSSFGVMLALNTQILLMGVTYSSSTSHDLAEWVCDVPYRHAVPRTVKLRLHNGSIVEQSMTDYQPKPSSTGGYYGDREMDFNRLGKMLEKRSLVGITAIGNAVVRRFAMRDLVDLAQGEALRDCDIFRTEEGRTSCTDFTHLDFGKIILSPERLDGAGRPERYQWSVVDESMMFKMDSQSTKDHDS